MLLLQGYQGSPLPVCLLGQILEREMGIRGATGSIMATGDTVGSEIWLLEGPLIRTSYWRNPFVCVCMCLNRGLGPATDRVCKDYHSYVCVYACAEYWQLKWGCSLGSSMSKCQQLGTLGCKGTYGHKHMYYAHMFHQQIFNLISKRGGQDG